METKELRDAAQDARAFVNATREGELMTHEAAIYKLAEYVLDTVKDDDDEPLTEEYLHSIGFQDDRAGTPTLGSLHIRPQPNGDYPAYACIRSVPIQVPANRRILRNLIEALKGGAS